MQLEKSPDWVKLYEALGLTEESAGDPSSIAKLEIGPGQVVITYVSQKTFTWDTTAASPE